MQDNSLNQPPPATPDALKQTVFKFQDLGARRVEADFSAGHISSDGGALWLGEFDQKLGLSRRLAECFVDHRSQKSVEHSVRELLAQRIMGIALGYEDLNDHDQMRRDPLLAVAVGKTDPLGLERHMERDRGRALAGSATLNRLELGHEGKEGASQYRKIVPQAEQIQALLLKMGVESLDPKSKVVVLDFDATDDPLHGRQEGRFFHGYYDSYCYLPLFCFVGSVPLWAQLRTSDRDGSDGTVEALAQIVPVVRQHCPGARIVLRADSGFARESIMGWCEAHQVYYVLGLARNKRLEGMLQKALGVARERHILSGGATCRHFTELEYRTLKSWSRARRVIGKAEVSQRGPNPRFLVTNIALEGFEEDPSLECFGDGRSLYEKFYCQRGECENQIKQMTLDLGATRLSTHWLASNQLRLWLHSFGYLLMERLRSVGLPATSLAKATLGQVRLKILKVGAWVQVSVRRVWVRLSSAYPWQDVWNSLGESLAAQGSASIST